MMYIIDRDQNCIQPVVKMTFSELGFRERDHLQEWIAKHPNALGEELLIIQKEFNGFNDTNERLDLLALDKDKNLIIIENKLDDSGRDVTWQALKYASYCSNLTTQQIKDIYQKYLDKYEINQSAEERLCEFFEVEDFQDIILNKGLTQRIILIAAHFRKEVTSTILYLLNYKLKVQCFKATPYQYGEQIFLNIEQIIPVKDSEEYLISVAQKAQEESDSQEVSNNRFEKRLRFWNLLLAELNKQTDLFQNINPIKDNWLSAAAGIASVSFNFGISQKYGKVEISMNRAKEENKFVFDEFYKYKSEIEQNFGDKLHWRRADNKKSSWIIYQNNDYNLFQEEQWDDMIQFLVDGMIRLEKAFKPYIAKVKSKLAQKKYEQ